MSSDPELERLLRDVREMLPEPHADVSRRARERALAALMRRRPRRVRTALLVSVGLVTAVVLGSALGAAVAPSGTAAGGPVRLGFVPEPGWYALQAAISATPAQPLVAMAANVPFAAEDSIHGLAEPSALPYSTLLELPARGIVIVAAITASELQPSSLTRYLSRFPLRIADASPYIDYGVEVRHEQPLGQYQLRASGDGWYVDIHVYFGTSEPSVALLAEAQRQLDELVVRDAPKAAATQVASKLAASAVIPDVSVVDRTFACTPSYGKFSVVVSPRATSEILGSRLTSSGYARVTWGSDAYALGDLVVVAKPGLRNSSIRFPGAVYASRARCVLSRASVPLARAGLPGPASAVRSDTECRALGKILVRVRAVLEAPASWRRLSGAAGRAYMGARGELVEGQLAVRDQRTGKPIAFATLGKRGGTRHWSAPYPRCF